MDDPIGDGSAVFVEVKLASKTLTLAMMPILSVLAQANAAPDVAIYARAVATSGTGTVICENAVFMTCDPTETENQSDYDNPIDIMTTEVNGVGDGFDQIGRQMVAKNVSGQNIPTAGNFGLLCPPGQTNCGATDVAQYIADGSADVCTDGSTLSNKTGNNVNPISDGVNAILDVIPGTGTVSTWVPAKNVINYDDDSDADLLSLPLSDSNHEVTGNAIWDLAKYWKEKHPNWVRNSISEDDWPTAAGNGIPDDLEDGTLGHPDNTADALIGVTGATHNIYVNNVPMNGVTYPNVSAVTFATRYQTYLYESGVTFQAFQQLTIYPALDLSDSDITDAMPEEIDAFTGGSSGTGLIEISPPKRWVAGATLKAGVSDTIANRDDVANWTCDVVVAGNGNQPDQTVACTHGDATNKNSDCGGPNADDLPHNQTCGIPLTGTTPTEDANRRVLYSAVVNCVALGLSGSKTFAHNGRYVALFLTSTVDATGSDEAVLMEIVGPVLTAGIGTGSAGVAGLEVGGHLSVRLVD